jgi:phage tail protein X
MAMASKLAALQTDLAALAGAVTYRQLADQLKVAIALSQQSGLAAVQVSLPTGVSMSYPTISVAVQALAQIEELAAGEAGSMAMARMRLA